MNIVLVVFDSLRKDCAGPHGPAPWGSVHTPHLDALAAESLVFDRAYPESLPTLPARRALYTGQRCYPFHGGDFKLKGDFVGAAGWGPIPEQQSTLSEMLRHHGYRTGLVADVPHMFKPSKNFWRGFDQWTFLRGQEADAYRSGPAPSEDEIDACLPPGQRDVPHYRRLVGQELRNMQGRTLGEHWFNACVMAEAGRWLEQNTDADRFFLTVESFDPHEPWFVPEHYRRMYTDDPVRGNIISGYSTSDDFVGAEAIGRTRASYSGLVTMCDRWFGHLYETMRVLGLLENTLLIVTSDHGHSLGDGGYLGKRAYPSHPSVFDIPLFVRHPDGFGAGERCDGIVQHTDIAAEVLHAAGVEPEEPIHGMPLRPAAGGGEGRDHATVAWGTGVTVVDRRWWFNAKVDGSGAFLHDLDAADPFAANVADENPDVVARLYGHAVADATGGFPDYIQRMVADQTDAPGCSAVAARPG